jgi:RHS repeat-associated protein
LEISERRGSTSTFIHGGLKNLDAQSSSSEVVTVERAYDAFGNVVGSSGTWNGPFGYAGGFGYQEDADSGLKLLGHRFYDSSTGRFLTRDPIKDRRNWYVYCDSNPISHLDAHGLSKWCKIPLRFVAGHEITPDPLPFPQPKNPPVSIVIKPPQSGITINPPKTGGNGAGGIGRIGGVFATILIRSRGGCYWHSACNQIRRADQRRVQGDGRLGEWTFLRWVDKPRLRRP